MSMFPSSTAAPNTGRIPIPLPSAGNSFDTVAKLDAVFQELETRYQTLRHAAVKQALRVDTTSDLTIIGNMERAVEFTERRIGQLEASVKFKSETVQSLKQKRADVMASMQKHEGIIRKLTATRAQLEQEARIAQDEVASLKLQVEQKMRHAAVLARDVVALRGQVNTANGMREHLSHQLNALTMNHTAVAPPYATTRFGFCYEVPETVPSPLHDSNGTGSGGQLSDMRAGDHSDNGRKSPVESVNITPQQSPGFPPLPSSTDEGTVSA